MRDGVAGDGEGTLSGRGEGEPRCVVGAEAVSQGRSRGRGRGATSGSAFSESGDKEASREDGFKEGDSSSG